MDDKKRKYFLHIISTYSNIELIDEKWDECIKGQNKLSEFINIENVLVLYASILRTNEIKHIEFATESNEKFDKLIVFYKTKPAILSEDNICDVVQFTSLHGSSNLALYHTLNNVFAPVLNKSNRKSAVQNTLEKQLLQLQAGLRATILTGNQESDPLKNVDKNSLNIILNLENELEFWNNAISNARNKDVQVQYTALRNLLVPLAKDFSVIDALPFIEVDDILENAHNILDDLWRHEPPYPKARMENLMDIIASDIIRCINKEVSKTDLWNTEYNVVCDILDICTSTGNRWITTCKQLTEIFWPNYSLHAWSGPGFIPINLTDLIDGLQEVLNIRTVHKQLIRLLTINEQHDLSTDDMFKPFKDLDVTRYNSHTEQQWRTAKKQFEYIIQPAEQRIAIKLKKQLSSINANTRQLLHEFGRYSELIKRPILKKILQSERQYLLGALIEYVKNISENSNGKPIINVKYDTPQVVAEISAVRQSEAKANDVQKISQRLLDDLQKYDELNNLVVELLESLKQQHNDLFESWSSEAMHEIKNKTLSLKENDPVVRFSNDKLMKVNYSPKLVTLVTEVRQLSAMGYRIPSNIEHTTELAKKFMKYAKILEQIANFHNTIGDRMIMSQRPMMLASAVNLSKLVQEEEVVCWAEINSVEKYIEKLKEAVEKLSAENNMLTSYHYQILDKIRDLENVDLIKHYQKWKDAAKSMRDIVAQVQNKGFKSLQSWKIDLDKQLIKILEVQYLKSLNTVHLYLPEIYTDLIYRDSHLEYSPDEKHLKQKYELQLKRFLDIPKNFRGISENLEFFDNVIDRSKYEIDKVNKNTDDLFEQLKSVVKHWESWLTLKALDPTKLNVWQDWDLHFRASKTFGQEIAKLPSTEERVGCFIIGLSRLRSDLESHNRSCWDSLTVSLKDAIVQDVVRLQLYVDNSTTALNRQPVTMEQIGEADASHANILRERPEMEDLYSAMSMKAKILATWNREQIDSVNRLQAAWGRLSGLLENHKHIISKQIETVKTTLNIATDNLHKEIERFEAKWDQVKPRPHSGQIATDSLTDLNKYLVNMKEKRTQWGTLMEQLSKIKEDHEKFSLEVPDLSQSEAIELDLKNLEDTWSLFEEFYTGLEELCNEEWIVFRKKIYKFEEFLFEWQMKLQKMDATALVTRILKEIQKFQEILPALKYTRGDDFTDTHWMEVYSVLEIIPKTLETLCLKDFLQVPNMEEKTKDLQMICKKAASEIIVRQALAELDQWEVQSHFIFTEHTDSHKKILFLIKDFKEVLNKIGDNQSLLQSVKNSSDFDSFFERAGLWENKLGDLDYYLTNLSQIQRKWVYLEPIFGLGTLIHEKSRFERLDRDFRNLLKFIKDDSRVCSLCRYSNIRALLENLQDQLGRCQKSLDNFLTEKRNNFPRFLFLGDDDLLEIVGQSSKKNVIQSHLKKLFAGIHSIRFDEQEKAIIAMCSLEGEVVGLSEFISIEKPVEIWMNNLVVSMQKTLKKLLAECLADGQNLDPSKYPSQILCLANSITFTTKCEQGISGMSLPSLLSSFKSQLNYYTSMEFKNDKSDSLTVELDTESYILDVKLKALVLDTIHHISVIQELINDNVTKASDWTWQKQLRYYSNRNGDISIKMVNAEMDYSYEYLGNEQKLVRTPLTEQCFLTLTQAMYLGMGGNPYGPAGTGKTESVKALGCLLGRQVLVFNCDEGIDASSMGRILSGLVKTGAWGCFDEFNRLDEATLSTISMYIQPIQSALKLKKNVVMLLDQEVQLNKHCGIFVTLNPAGGSYGGRNKLPDNLKQLFRPVVMTHPDHEQIAKTLLHCDGYKKADVIAPKLVEVFNMSSQLLSKQHHYDWGLRALKTVLNGCGQSMKQNKRKNKDTIIEDFSLEYSLVVGALRIDTISKLTLNDAKKFDALIKDVFPNVSLDMGDHKSLRQALECSCKELQLCVNSRQLEKCVELYQQLRQRMGVAIVGPSCSGKSSARNILFHALNKMGKAVKQKIFNPKSLSKNQLLGQIDVDTRQWSDGILPQYSLQVTSEPSDVWSWIVCDGDIDPEWVESLNSVLDDNRLLSLPSGWRIQFGPNVNFVFETHELRSASPATISRMGIVFLEDKDIQLKDVIDTFTATNSDTSGVFETYINDYFIKAIDWIQSNGEVIMNRSKIGLARTALSQVINATNKSEFIVNLINGLGCQLDIDFKEVLAQQIFDWTGDIPPNNLTKLVYNQNQETIESYSNKYSYNAEFLHSDLIQTPHVAQALSYLRKWLSPGKEQHFLLVGPHGSAKHLILENLIRQRSDIELTTIHCSAYVTPQYLIHKLKQHCIIISSNKGRVYKPKKGHLVVHFKNMHLLKRDKWGTNMLVEFLQQLISYNGFFDDSLEWVGLEKVTVVGTMSDSNTISIRFSSILHVYSIELPELEDLNIICNHQLTEELCNILPKNNVWTKSKISQLTNTLVSIYQKIKQTFTTNDSPHYIFSPNNLTNLCKNLSRYNNDSNMELENFILEIVYFETQKTFGNRVTNNEDRVKINAILNNTYLNDWGKSNFSQKLVHSFYVPTFSTSAKSQNLTKINKDDWTTLIKKGILQFERDGSKLNMLILPELLYLTACASRTMTMEEGNLLLVGCVGVGRKSAVKIVSSLQNAKLIIPSSTKVQTFCNEVKLAMQQSGIEGEHVNILLEDHLLNNKTILNMVNTLLCSGEIPGLYNEPELESLIVGLKDEASRENFEGDLRNFFVERVRKKLHIITCLDKNNKNLWDILVECPTFYQKCDIIWMSDWEQESMEEVPQFLLKKLNHDLKICQSFADIHNTIKTKINTPFRFIDLVKTYMDVYSKKKEEISKKETKLKAGVTKLTEARQVVDELKLKASDQQEKLAEKQSMANSALDMISNTMRDANTQKKEMENLKKDTETENEVLKKRQKDIEVELAEVEPLIKQASAAVGNIKTEALSEIRSLRAPPDVIRDILEGVLRLMGIQDTSWNSMKTFLAKRGVKEDIKAFEASRINPDSRQAVERLLRNKSDSFDSAVAKRASVAAAPLAAWVTANVRYSHVLDKIKPLTTEQNKLKRNLEQSKHQLGELSAGLSDVDATVQKLKEQLSTYTKEAAEIEIGLKTVQDTLNAAQVLVDRLNDEYERWQDQLQGLSQELANLPANCLMAAAFIVYLSSESEDVRIKQLETWKGLLQNIFQIDFSLERFLSSEREQLQWQSEGLGSDQLSIQNAIVILNSNIFPLIVDPTSSAVTFIQSHFKHKTIETITDNSPKFYNTLELAIRFGKVLIVEDLEIVPPELLPILRKEFVHQGERRMINLCGKLIDYHTDFQLILNSRNMHLKLPAYLQSVITIVNFNITHSGLTEKLLISAIIQQNPVLEDRRKELLRNREELQEKQFNLQNKLLEDLATSTGNILENKSLLESLNETKASSNAISQALEESNQIRQKLQQEYDAYNEISSFASLLYFAILEFSKDNILYAISISSYTKLYLKSISSSEDIGSTAGFHQRILLQSVYQFVGRGLLKVDRLKFLLHLIHQIYPNQIHSEEWSTFLGLSIPAKDTKPGDAPSWLPDHTTYNIQFLQQSQPELYVSLNLSEKTLWNTFMESNDCETKLPQHCKLREFQRVLVVQALRPDRLYSALIQFVMHLSGLKNLNLEVLQFLEIFNESSAMEPILILTTTGNDPSVEIRKLANLKIGIEKYDEVAMGEGQEGKALAKLEDVALKGHWLTLTNLHLVTKWLPTLSQHLNHVDVHPDFRLWLITEPHMLFSPVLAQNCMKIAYEAPAGLKSNIQRTYATWDLNYLSQLAPTGARIFFVLACIHALLQERRIYIPQGWSKWYEFSDIDLITAVKLSEKIWNVQNGNIAWKFIKGLCLDAVYGGRTESIQDNTILEGYLNQFLNDEVLSHRWKPFGLNNSIPMTSKFQEYVNLIHQLPNRDLPSYFGLPENINRSWEQNVSKEIISELRSLQEYKDVQSNFNKDLWHKGLSPYINLWKKLNQGQDFVKINLHALPERKNESPISDFMQEEFYNALTLIQSIHKCFTALNRILRSNVTADKDIFEIGTYLINQKLPISWLQQWKGPSDPNKYLRCLIVKTKKIRNWQNDHLDAFLKTPINLSFLFNPEAFLAAFKQHFSRKHSIPLDELILQTNWKPTQDFLILEGLLISGALFDGFILSSCIGSTESVNSIPNCYMGFVNKKSSFANDKLLDAPLYLTSNRAKKLTSLQISCDPKDKDKLITSGLAFFLAY